MFNITAIPALKDNYIWCITDPAPRQCVIVDPGEASPVKMFLQKQGLTLSGILITHHHGDHTAGIAELIQGKNIPVYGSDLSPVSTITVPLKANSTFTILNHFSLQALAVPGHTLDHIAYYGEGKLFPGDTLFSAGCGRLFEGTAEMMYQSLQKLAALPVTTEIYCGHEYTLANLKFAQTVEPNNTDIQAYYRWAENVRAKHLPTLPSTIVKEKLVNPFFRSDQSSVIQSVQKHMQIQSRNPSEIFKYTRLWKDQF